MNSFEIKNTWFIKKNLQDAMMLYNYQFFKKSNNE